MDARSVTAALVALALAACEPAGGALPGFPYSCADKCNEMRQTIADHSFNPDSGAIGGLSPDTVCDDVGIQAATTCPACREAIRDVHHIEFNRLKCDCPAENDRISIAADSGTPGDDGGIVFVVPTLEACAAAAL